MACAKRGFRLSQRATPNGRAKTRLRGPSGIGLIVVTGLAPITVAEVAFVYIVKRVWFRNSGGPGSSGGSPEERVLDDDEYEDFEPIENLQELMSNH